MYLLSSSNHKLVDSSSLLQQLNCGLVLCTLVKYFKIVIIFVTALILPFHFAYAHVIDSKNIQIWKNFDDNLKIEFGYLPERPIIDTFTTLQFSVTNLETAEHVKDSISSNNLGSIKHSQNVDTLLERLSKYDSKITKDTNFVHEYNANLNELNLTTKAFVAANLADESMREYGLAKGLDPNVAAALSNMNLGMIMQTGKPTMNMTMNMTHGKILPNLSNSVKSDNQTLDKGLSLEQNQIVNTANYASSAMLAESLDMLYSENLRDAKLQNSTGLMRIPMSMKAMSVVELGQGIDNLQLALKNRASLEEVYSIVHAQIHPNLFWRLI